MLSKLLCYWCLFVLALVSCQASGVINTTNAPIDTSTPTKGVLIISPTTSQSSPTNFPTDIASIATETPSPTLSPSLESITNPSSTPVSTPEPQHTETKVSYGKKPIIVDHTSIELFDQIPEAYLEAARNLRLVFVDRSVGENINRALDCLTASSWAQSSPGCRRDYIDSSWNWKLFDQTDLSSGRVPNRITFQPNPQKYNRNQWTYVFLRPGDWKSATQEFFEEIVPLQINSKDVFSLQFGYGEVDQASDIVDPNIGFFSESPDRYEISDFELFRINHPDKILVFWTTALSRKIGTQEASDFNDRLRLYVQGTNGALLDLADIISHTDQGVPCYDNRDGIRYCDQSGDCENHPDDGQQFLAICQDYTTETNAGHLGSVSAGKIRLAKAMWVLMAQLAGWEPD